MSSRGAVIKNGHVTIDEYNTVRTVYDAKVLVGNGGRHSLPDYSHSPNRIYIKENSDGSFKELRAYDCNGNPIIEIAYHIEPAITGNRTDKVLHYHTFKEDLSRDPGIRLSPDNNKEMYERFRKYLEEFGL
jgi:hypothetical protein